ncbi:MAG: hypothetical protein CL912_23075 [Deltaproteobacteria bacterium]|nr:hypothetical protein [Deltaproteobacteria bacterium]
MSNFGDPGFHIHSTMGQFLTLLAYHLSSDELLPLDLPNYGVELQAYYEDLQDVISSGSNASLDTSPLSAAIQTFQARTKEVKGLEQMALMTNDAELIEVVNHKYRDFQRGFVSQGGLPTREFYRHVVTAPGLDTGYAAVTYAGITEAVEAGDFDVARDWVGRTARGIERASEIIKT